MNNMNTKNPFVKVNTQNTVGIENVIPKILKPQNQQQKSVGCAAYLAAKDYFDNLRNRIKTYDPESVIDYYIIDISDHPSRPGSSTDFNVTITTKDGHDKVGSFNVERKDPNQPVDWNNVMDELVNNITSIIKYYKSAPLINEDIETLKQNVDALKQKMTTTQSKNSKDNAIETTTDDNVVYYPVSVENTTENNETPELDKAKGELNQKMTQGKVNKTQKVLSSKVNNVIETTTDDNVVYYPVLVENTTENNETPELDKAKEEINNIYNLNSGLSEKEFKEYLKSANIHDICDKISRNLGMGLVDNKHLNDVLLYYISNNTFKDFDSFSDIDSLHALVCVGFYNRYKLILEYEKNDSFAFIETKYFIKYICPWIITNGRIKLKEPFIDVNI